jgi:glycosyltransferase involved in cell wall biosynthesis
MAATSLTERKVLFIDASNIRAGGGLTHLIELLRVASPADSGIHEVIVGAPDSSLLKIEARPWLTKYSHPFLNKNYLFRFLWQLRVLPGLVRSRQAILFIPGAGKPMFNYPYVTMCRNLLPLDYKELFRFGFSFTTFRLLILRFLHLSAYKHSQGVIFLTQYCYDILPPSVRQRIKNKTVIPHGINHSMFNAQQTTKKESQIFNLLYISIINLYKHQGKVAQAVINLNKRGYHIHLTLIGSAYGPALKKLQRVVVGHEQWVTYKGKVPYEQLAKEYHDHDAFIMASTCETFCMILTEAMAMGMPIACSSKSSLPETLGEAGIYFDPEQVSSIEQSVLNLLKDKDLRNSLSGKAIERSNQYSWDVCAKKTFEFIASL